MTLLLTLAVLTQAPQGTGTKLAPLHAYLYASSYTEAAREAEVKALLAREPALANASDDGSPVLFAALDLLDVEGDLGRRGRRLADLLAAAGARLDALDKSGEPPMLRYALFGRLEQLQWLVAHRAAVDPVDEDGRSPLGRLATLTEASEGEPRPAKTVERWVAAMKLLLEAGARLDRRDRRGVTPLATAAFLGNLKLSSLLIDRGADVNARDDRGWSVLGRVLGRADKDSAANERERRTLPPVIELLKKHGARDERPK